MSLFARVTGDDRLDPHAIVWALTLEALGEFTSGQVVAGLNDKLSEPLSGAELVDLAAVQANAAVGSNTAKLIYLRKIEAIVGVVAAGYSVSEAKFKSVLGI